MLLSVAMLAKLSSLLYNWVPHDAASIFLVFVTTFVIAASLFTFYNGNKNRPPGPWGLPIMGYLPFLDKPAHVTLAKLIPKYGPIIRMQLGSMNCVVLGTCEAIKEAFVKQNENFSGRPDYLSFKVYDNDPSFIYTDGEDWKELRTFSVLALRELGFGRQSLEPVVESEIQFFIKALEDESHSHSTGFPVGAILEKSIGNAVCSLFIGHRCDYNDPWLNRLVEVVDGLQETYVADFVFFFPWMLKTPLLSKLVENKKKRALKDELWSLWREKIEVCKKEGDNNGPNFLHSWLQEHEKRLEKKDPTAKLFTEFSLLGNIDLLCQASFETTSTTLQWAFLFMLENPEIQTKLQHEIDDIIGHERLPQYADAKNMPYTKAFIAETHRKGSIVPLGVFHRNHADTELMGYWIPKRTIMIPNQYAVHHDPKVFKDPEKFDPNRFLENGKFVKHESVIPFSMGKRFCPGEFVAEMELFLYLMSLLQNYTIIAPSGLSFDFTAKDTIVNHPPAFNMCIKRR